MGRPIINIIGKKFGRLVVDSFFDKTPSNNLRFLCVCECGKKIIVQYSNLISSNTKSCGCLNIEMVKERSTTHGYCKNYQKPLIYGIWRSMIQRCSDQNDKCYKDYGGRGIKVCGRWLPKNNGFINFLEDVGERPKGKSLDRINNDGNYCPENYRWSTPKEQSRNTRRTKIFTFKNKTQCLKDWADEYKIDYTILWKRLCKKNWSIERTLMTPVRKVYRE